MLRKLLSTQPILCGTVVALVFGYLLGQLMLRRHREAPPPMIDRVVLPAEYGLNDPSIPPIRLTGTLLADDVVLGGKLSLVRQVEAGEIQPGLVETRVADDGTFTLEVLAGPGAYVALFEAGSAAGHPLPLVIEVPVHVPLTDELTVELELPRGRIVGSVLDRSGTPLANTPVELRRYGTTDPYAQAETDSAGSFGFRCLPLDVYTLAVLGADGARTEENVHLLDEPTRSLTLALGE